MNRPASPGPRLEGEELADRCQPALLSLLSMSVAPLELSPAVLPPVPTVVRVVESVPAVAQTATQPATAPLAPLHVLPDVLPVVPTIVRMVETVPAVTQAVSQPSALPAPAVAVTTGVTGVTLQIVPPAIMPAPDAVSVSPLTAAVTVSPTTAAATAGMGQTVAPPTATAVPVASVPPSQPPVAAPGPVAANPVSSQSSTAELSPPAPAAVGSGVESVAAAAPADVLPDAPASQPVPPSGPFTTFAPAALETVPTIHGADVSSVGAGPRLALDLPTPSMNSAEDADATTERSGEEASADTTDTPAVADAGEAVFAVVGVSDPEAEPTPAVEDTPADPSAVVVGSDDEPIPPPATAVILPPPAAIADDLIELVEADAAVGETVAATLPAIAESGRGLQLLAATLLTAGSYWTARRYMTTPDDGACPTDGE